MPLRLGFKGSSLRALIWARAGDLRRVAGEGTGGLSE
jgi:hypothetical protein